MGFTLIDMETWPRRPYYEHYMNAVRCTYSLTVNIDIARLLPAVKRAGAKLYPALIFMLAQAVNRHEAFRYAHDAQGRVGLWDTLHPSYTVFHDDDKTFSSLWTEDSPDFETFFTRYLEDQQAYGGIHAFNGKPNEPANIFNVSGIPWAHFTAMNLNVYGEGTFLAPIFTIGKYEARGEQLLLPLAVQAHHAVCDGYHVSQLLADVQQMADTPDDWLLR